MKDIAILSVDDEKIIIDSIRRQLEKNYSGRYLLEFAESAEEALELTESLIEEGVKILLIISDYMMAGMKGDEFAAAVKHRYPDVNIVMLTGQMNTRISQELVSSNVVMKVIQKPWKETELIELIDHLSAQLTS